MLIPRTEYLNQMKRLIDKEEIKIISGVRRCGKTYFLKIIIEELKKRNINEKNIIHLNFESSIFDDIEDYKDLNNYIFEKVKNLEGKVYLFFDEIQMVKNWEKSINAYRIDLNCDIYITGSNSQLLSGELSTLLSGRFKEMKLYPFSFNEIIEYYKGIKTENQIFKEYLEYGGLPGVLKYDLEDKLSYIDDIYHSIVIKDIISKNSIKNVDFLERLLKFTISHVGKTFSARSISKFLKQDKVNLSPHTIINYLKFAIDAFVLIKVPREDIKEKRILTVSEKYYVIDIGFYQIQTGIIKNYGQILENIVLLELLRRGYKVSVGKIRNLEIDFICRKYNETIYIQVSQSVADENTLKREMKPYEFIQDNYKKYLITLDQLDYSQNGVIHLNIIDFLKNSYF